MTDKHRRMESIGHISGHDDSTDHHPEYSLTVIGGVYVLMLIPVVLLAYGLSLHNNWSTDITILFFAGAMMVFTIVYLTIAMGIFVPLVKTLLGFLYKRRVVDLQFRAYAKTLEHEYPEITQQAYPQLREVNRPLLPDQNHDRNTLMEYLKFLYQQDDTGEYLNIYADGRIKGAVPWSSRQRKINEQVALNWFDKVSYQNKPLVYYKDKGWYLNVNDYPYLDRVLKSFERTYVPTANIPQIEEGEFRDAE